MCHCKTSSKTEQDQLHGTEGKTSRPLQGQQHQQHQAALRLAVLESPLTASYPPLLYSTYTTTTSMSLKTPELSLDLINDALEYHSHVIVNGTMEDEGALEDHWDSLRYFWKISDDHQPSCGRIFHRCRLAELVFYACNRHPYGELDEETPKHVAAKEEEIHAMVNWEPKDWASLKRKLVRVCHSIKREDANRTVRSQDDERPEEVPERANDQNFSGKHIAYLVRHITINKHLSHIRLQMEEWRRSNSRKQPHIDEADLMEFQ